MSTVRIEVPEPHAGQQRVLEEAGRFNVLECGRRFGKTTLGEFLLAIPAIEGHPVGWFAPTFKYLTEAWRNVLRILTPLNPKPNVQERRIELPTGGVAEFWSLDDPNAGRSRKYKRVIIDEAGIVRGLKNIWDQAIRPTLTDLQGDAWFLGTPKGRGDFHRLFDRGQGGERGWKSWRLPTTANPYMPAEEIEAARADMPEAAFAQEYLGIPADDGGNPFGLSAIRAATVDNLSRGDPVCYGIDLAKSHDYTVVCGLDASGAVCVLERWQSDWGQTRRRIRDMVGGTPTVVDSTGVGDPIVEDLRAVLDNVQGFKFSASSKQQLMEGLAAAIQKREITFPRGWLTSELESFEYEYRAGGVRYSAPEGLHDDGVCALALAVNARRAPREWDSGDWGKVFDWQHQQKKTPREMLLDRVRGNRR